MANHDSEDKENEMQEGTTPAADTLKPKGAPGDSKAKTLDTFVQLLSQLGREDLTNLFDKVQSQYGENKTPGAVDKSASNRDTVKMKPSSAQGKGAWKEDIDDLFAGDELNEDQRQEIETVFESAVNTRIALVTEELNEELEGIISNLEEQYSERLEEETSQIFEELTEKLDQYLDYVVEQWVEENQIELESSLRVDVAENFIDSLKGLFTEHYIKVPETQLDIVSDLASELEAVKEELDKTTDEVLELRTLAEHFNKVEIIQNFAEGLTDLEADKLVNLAENLDFEDENSFSRKVGILKEKYFGVKSKDTGILTEEFLEESDGDLEEMDPSIQAVANLISSRKGF